MNTDLRAIVYNLFFVTDLVFLSLQSSLSKRVRKVHHFVDDYVMRSGER